MEPGRIGKIRAALPVDLSLALTYMGIATTILREREAGPEQIGKIVRDRKAGQEQVLIAEWIATIILREWQVAPGLIGKTVRDLRAGQEQVLMGVVTLLLPV